MITYVTLLCATGLLLGAGGAKAPRALPPYSIRFSAHAGITGADFRVELQRHANVVFLRYGRMDSVRYTALHHDPHFRAAMSALEANRGPAADRTRAAARALAVLDRYTVYRWDSLQVAPAAHPALVQLLDSVYQSPAAALQRIDANRGRIVLDGTQVRVEVRTGPRIEKSLTVESPNPVTHPLLYRLLRAALDLHRQQHPAALLDRRYTNGY